jgi:tetratricopeptide (TPR) repeat protein
VVAGTYRYIVATQRFPSRWLAYVFGMRGNKALGIAMIQAVAADDRAFVNAQSALLLILTREQRYEEAFAAALALMNAMPRNRLFILEAGAAAARAGRLDEAERLLNEGLASFKRDPRPKAAGEAALWYYTRGATRLAAGKLEEAGQDLDIALDSEPIGWVRGRIHLELGKRADVEGRRSDALTAYALARAMADDNDDPTGRDEADRWRSRPFSLPAGPGGTKTLGNAGLAGLRGLSGNARGAETVR